MSKEKYEFEKISRTKDLVELLNCCKCDNRFRKPTLRNIANFYISGHIN